MKIKNGLFIHTFWMCRYRVYSIRVRVQCHQPLTLELKYNICARVTANIANVSYYRKSKTIIMYLSYFNNFQYICYDQSGLPVQSAFTIRLLRRFFFCYSWIIYLLRSFCMLCAYFSINKRKTTDSRQFHYVLCTCILLMAASVSVSTRWISTMM